MIEPVFTAAASIEFLALTTRLSNKKKAGNCRPVIFTARIGKMLLSIIKEEMAKHVRNLVNMILLKVIVSDRFSQILY